MNPDPPDDVLWAFAVGVLIGVFVGWLGSR